MKIADGEYRGISALILESAVLRAAILPQRGGKMASLIHKLTGTEVLSQPDGEIPGVVSYGKTFETIDSYGFDEMFPTIVQCYCDVEPWQGTALPDHGEVWSLPWRARTDGDRLRLQVHGVRLPYILTKTVSIEPEETVVLHYRVENPSPFDLPALWAAHPLFNIAEGSRLILPASARTIMNTAHGTSLGDYGACFAFPHAEMGGGRVWDLSRIGAGEGRHCFKYYFLDGFEEGFALIHEPKSRMAVGLAWPASLVPYLGVWVNEGAWGGQYNAALEPCTAPFDRWDTARQWGRLPVVPAGGYREWELRLTVGLADDPRGVEPDGRLR